MQFQNISSQFANNFTTKMLQNFADFKNRLIFAHEISHQKKNEIYLSSSSPSSSRPLLTGELS